MSDQEATTVGDDSLRETVNRLRRKLADQQERIAALARGREESLETIAELREELALVRSERDRLRAELTTMEGMQTATLALDEKSIGDETDAQLGEMPSIDDLMATFSGANNVLSPSHSTSKVELDGDGQVQEMLSPDQMLLGSRRREAAPAEEQYLVLLEPGQNAKCPLDQELLTIGRSESADIKVEGDFISRIHARVLRIGMDSVVEDAGSKNGIHVNGDRVGRHKLVHGDLLRIGNVSFRFVDTRFGSSDAD